MARLDINKPYQDFLQTQVNAGLFRSITAAAEDAIRNEMLRHENRRIASVMAEVQKGELDVVAGRTQVFNSELLESIALRGKDTNIKKSAVQ